MNVSAMAKVEFIRTETIIDSARTNWIMELFSYYALLFFFVHTDDSGKRGLYVLHHYPQNPYKLLCEHNAIKYTIELFLIKNLMFSITRLFLLE